MPGTAPEPPISFCSKDRPGLLLGKGPQAGARLSLGSRSLAECSRTRPSPLWVSVSPSLQRGVVVVGFFPPGRGSALGAHTPVARHHRAGPRTAVRQTLRSGRGRQEAPPGQGQGKSQPVPGPRAQGGAQGRDPAPRPQPPPRPALSPRLMLGPRPREDKFSHIQVGRVAGPRQDPRWWGEVSSWFPWG